MEMKPGDVKYLFADDNVDEAMAAGHAPDVAYEN
jgi:hypothetical protein